MKLDDDIWVCGDQHFGHSNIIKYENRPFPNVQSMDNHIINQWNKTVHNSSKILALGDFSFRPYEQTKEILKKLNGYKMLIMGNHDLRKSNDYYLRCGFVTVSRYPIIYKNIVFSHNPIKIAEPFVNVHAHMHSKSLNSPNHICVSYEHFEKPIQLKELDRWAEFDNKRANCRIIKEYNSNWYK